jgi:hypothetical protein
MSKCEHCGKDQNPSGNSFVRCNCYFKNDSGVVKKIVPSVDSAQSEINRLEDKVKSLEELNEIYKGFLDKMSSPPYWEEGDYMAKLRYEYEQLKKLREKLND